jgi:hypothetical protein
MQLPPSMASMCLIVASCLPGGAESLGDQTYLQYVDEESNVIKRPQGEGWSDPFGDGVWRSSWFYASLIVLKAEDPAAYGDLVQRHGVKAEQAKKFLEYFLANNTGSDEWTLPKNPSQKFSRDQLVPLLYLLAAVHKYDADARPVAKDILKKLIELVDEQGGVSDSTQGEVRENLKYVIDVLARKYGLDSVSGATRGVYKNAFSLSLKADNAQAQLPGDLATADGYSVFNRLSLVTLQGLVWGVDDSDVKDWRKNYKVHADKGWGPAFRLVAGRSLSGEDIKKYASAYIKRDQDNDIIMGQRPSKYLAGDFPEPQFGQADADGALVLDFVVLSGLHAAWK